jgi:hypothetical protein
VREAVRDENAAFWPLGLVVDSKQVLPITFFVDMGATIGTLLRREQRPRLPVALVDH